MQILTRCRSLYGVLGDYVDARLGLRGRFVVRGHLLLCRKCRAYLREYRRVHELTGMVCREELPEDFDAAMERVLRRWKDGDWR